MRGVALFMLMVATPALGTPVAVLKATLVGANEVKRLGDPLGTGAIRVRLDPSRSVLCYDLRVDRVDGVTMAHLHRGAAGTTGAPVVMLNKLAGGVSKGCTKVADDVLSGMMARPADYYVNVHSARFPDGAVRGQLGR